MLFVDSNKNYPINYPIKMSGNLTHKIIIKKDYVRSDGTSALYIQIFLNKKRKRIPLNIFISKKDFCEKKQRVKGKSQTANDYNLLIEKNLGKINSIQISYRLSNQTLTLDKLIFELTNPSSRIDFIKFWETQIEKQKELLKATTYRQQYSTLTKIKNWKNEILFNEINEDLIKELKVYCRKKLKNKETTVQSTIKNFKKYLHIANKLGIRTELEFDDISVRSFEGDRTFLDPTELQILYEYYLSQFISDSHKIILSHFMFACFTSIRFSDVQNLSEDNIIGDYVVITAEKTSKIHKIKLNSAAKKFIKQPKFFQIKYTNEHVNRELKFITKVCKIKKHITFHCSRHTFATNYLINKGQVQDLQNILGHSNIRETMRYVHIVKAYMNEDIDNLSNILKIV